MTAKEVERLRAVEENQQATNEKLDYLIERFDKFTEKYETDKESYVKKFVTRAEALAFGLALSVVVTAVTLWMNLKEHIK